MEIRRTALITGASRGLGCAIAQALAASGFDVAVNYFSQGERAERLCRELETYGSKARAFQGNVRDERQVARMVKEVDDALGPVDVLVLNATGPQPLLAIEEQTWESYLDQLEFFVKSPLLLVKQVLPKMKARHFGRIIQIGSEVFEVGVPRFANYVAAKGAQLGMTRSWARELASFGITVNLVAPGWIPTERHADASAEEIAEYTKQLPIGHLGKPEDIGRTVAFLAGDDAGFITGQKISVNGGHTLA
jgi:3-oxoacyl-[acyl-carrier protein] reductase